MGKVEREAAAAARKEKRAANNERYRRRMAEIEEKQNRRLAEIKAKDKAQREQHRPAAPPTPAASSGSAELDFKGSAHRQGWANRAPERTGAADREPHRDRALGATESGVHGGAHRLPRCRADAVQAAPIPPLVDDPICDGPDLLSTDREGGQARGAGVRWPLQLAPAGSLNRPFEPDLSDVGGRLRR